MRRLLQALTLVLLAQSAAAQYPSTPGTATNPAAVPGATGAADGVPTPPGTFTPLFPQSSTAPAAPRQQQAPAARTEEKAPPPPAGPRPFDYSINLASDVFGASMFTGAFAASSASIYNPDHVIGIGDQLQVRLWGAFQFDALLTVDAQGNIFLPQVGPIRVMNVANKELPRVLEESLRRTFRSNVFSYISLAAAQPVRVFVTGFVHRPGMYQGTSTDSILRYLDQAGGIDADRGSFLDVQVLRGSQVRAQFNLYDFLLSGKLPGVQLADGDVVLVQPRKSMFKVGGLAANAKRFEFTGAGIELARLSALARPMPNATHVRVNRNSGIVRNTEYFPLRDAGTVQLDNGDDIEFTADKRPGTITVRVEGEHVSPQEYVLPYGARMGELIKQIEFTERSDSPNLQLFRVSVKERQRQMLQASLKSLENAVLTARSGTAEESRLRTEEAQLMLQWVERARNVEPLGQVVIAQARSRDDLLLENGDIVRVPVRNGLVLVHGEVLFPNAVAHESGYSVEDYIKRAGGYSQKADTSRIIVAHRDGSFDEDPSNSQVRPGDDILVLPRPDNKPRQFWKDIVQIVFQIAAITKIVLND